MTSNRINRWFMFFVFAILAAALWLASEKPMVSRAQVAAQEETQAAPLVTDSTSDLLPVTLVGTLASYRTAYPPPASAAVVQASDLSLRAVWPDPSQGLMTAQSTDTGATWFESVLDTDCCYRSNTSCAPRMAPFGWS